MGCCFPRLCIQTGNTQAPLPEAHLFGPLRLQAHLLISDSVDTWQKAGLKQGWPARHGAPQRPGLFVQTSDPCKVPELQVDIAFSTALAGSHLGSPAKRDLAGPVLERNQEEGK